MTSQAVFLPPVQPTACPVSAELPSSPSIRHENHTGSDWIFVGAVDLCRVRAHDANLIPTVLPRLTNLRRLGTTRSCCMARSAAAASPCACWSLRHSGDCARSLGPRPHLTKRPRKHHGQNGPRPTRSVHVSSPLLAVLARAVRRVGARPMLPEHPGDASDLVPRPQVWLALVESSRAAYQPRRAAAGGQRPRHASAAAANRGSMAGCHRSAGRPPGVALRSMVTRGSGLRCMCGRRTGVSLASTSDLQPSLRLPCTRGHRPGHRGAGGSR